MKFIAMYCDLLLTTLFFPIVVKEWLSCVFHHTHTKYSFEVLFTNFLVHFFVNLVFPFGETWKFMTRPSKS